MVIKDFKMLKNYMMLIYKIYGDCKLDNYADLMSGSKDYKTTLEELRKLEEEISSEVKARNLSENIVDIKTLVATDKGLKTPKEIEDEKEFEEFKEYVYYQQNGYRITDAMYHKFTKEICDKHRPKLIALGLLKVA